MGRERRLRLVSGAMALLFLCVAAGRLVTGALPLYDPVLSVAHVSCVPIRCRIGADPADLLPPRTDHARASPSSAEISAFARTPTARAELFVSRTLRAVPAALLFLFLGLALRRFSRGGFDDGGLAWMRRAATAALAGVLLGPVADTVRASAMTPLTAGRGELFLMFNGDTFFAALLLAGGVRVCVWALEDALRLRRELAEIV